MEQTGEVIPPEPYAGSQERALSPFWDWVPVALSLLTSAIFIIRSAVTLNGQRGYVLFDDAAISMRYARNLATGHGLAWNPGQHPVEGYSNLLWTLWMAVIELAHPPDRLAALGVMASGAVLLAANVYVIVRIARRIAPESHVVPILSGLSAALYYALTSWTLVGMETGLVALLYSLAILCALRACDPASPSPRHSFLLSAGILLALAVLARDDALVVALVVIAFVLLRSRPRIVSVALTGLPVVLVSVGHLVFRLIYYGLPLPNTYYLKVDGIPLGTRLVRGLTVLGQNATLQLVVPLILTAAFFVIALLRGRRPCFGSGLLLAVFAAQMFYMVYVGGDAYDAVYTDRYLALVAPFLFVLAALGADEIARQTRRWLYLVIVGVVIATAGAVAASSILPTYLIQIPVAPAWRLTSWAAAILVAGFAICAIGVHPVFKVVPMSVTACGLVLIATLSTDAIPWVGWYQHVAATQDVDLLGAREGIALAETTPVNATIAVIGAGNISLFDHRRSVDLLGYSDHFVAIQPPHAVTFMPGHDKWDYAYSVGTLRPDVVFGLFYPTPGDVRDMAAWGYKSYYFGYDQVYYRPGWFDPSRFYAAYLAS